MPDYSELSGEVFYLSDREDRGNSEDNEKEYTAAGHYQALSRRQPWMEKVIRQEKEIKEKRGTLHA